ncbi:NAD(P)-dependent oxidoreductase [Synechococcus sp. 8F6]|uniref:NAD-dependent epimerase/dehydratase family protein n=1 Tax=Synechococcus sp. 8F6 TaxID=2025606 RepID=UPI001303CBFA|nr:NAD-dependent epimerase/dehydratase family protein [Synechococcus sp. 8F6]
MLTGGSGFIGSAFLKSALASGLCVRVLTRKPYDRPPQAGLEVVEGDLTSTLDWTRALRGVHVVVHTAAELKDAELMPVVNVQGPTHLLHAAVNAGVKRWVQLSSVGAFGPDCSGVVTEEWPDNPSGSYEISKTQFDDLLRKLAQDNTIEVCIVRPSNVYGPGMHNESIRAMLRSMQKGLFAFIGPPGASANYVHVDDVVQALRLCVQKPQAANRTYIVSAWATMEDMVQGLASGAGLMNPLVRIDVRLAKVLAYTFKWLPGWPLTVSRVKAMSLRSYYSTQRIESELGWKLTVPVHEGMHQLAGDFAK